MSAPRSFKTSPFCPLPLFTAYTIINFRSIYTIFLFHASLSCGIYLVLKHWTLVNDACALLEPPSLQDSATF